MNTFVIGIAGGTGAGKTTLATAVVDRLETKATLIAHDAYYRDLSALDEVNRAKVNFDSPESLETELLVAHLDALKGGESVSGPVYDFTTHCRLADRGRDIAPSAVVIVEGILLLAVQSILPCLDLKVFVEADSDERILRRIRRDVDERGRTVSSVMEQYLGTVKPMHEKYVAPSRAKADLVVNGGRGTARAVEVIVAHVEARLRGM